MICPKCNGTIEDGSKFCRHCGAAVSEPAATASPSKPAGKLTAPADDARGVGADVYGDPKHERQVWQGRPAWRSYYGIWATWALLSAVVLGAAYKWKAPDSPAVWLALLCVLGAAVAILVREAMFVLSYRYRLTTQRLFIHRGILSRTTDQTELMRVDDVRLRQGVIDRLVNTGDVEVMGTDETDDVVILKSVSAPAEVAEALRVHVHGARSKRTLMVEQV
ncbi:MAG: PH domain-containing protein [Phycisphaerae bacterium]|nr:PH domain-containing protein [Phycisphaerae bacterium]